MAETKKPTHELRLLIGDKVYKGKGNNTFSALKKIKLPKDLKAIGHIEAVVDGKLFNFPITLYPIKMKRLFAKEWELELLAKRLDVLQ